MALSPKGNVVPLDDHPRAKSRLSKKESADVLAGCRQLALDRIKSALSGMLDRVEDELFAFGALYLAVGLILFRRQTLTAR